MSLEKLNLDTDSSQVLNLQLHGMEQLDDCSGNQLTAVSGMSEHHSPDSMGQIKMSPHKDNDMDKQWKEDVITHTEQHTGASCFPTWLDYHICRDLHI